MKDVNRVWLLFLVIGGFILVRSFADILISHGLEVSSIRWGLVLGGLICSGGILGSIYSKKRNRRTNSKDVHTTSIIEDTKGSGLSSLIRTIRIASIFAWVMVGARLLIMLPNVLIFTFPNVWGGREPIGDATLEEHVLHLLVWLVLAVAGLIYLKRKRAK